MPAEGNMLQPAVYTTTHNWQYCLVLSNKKAAGYNAGRPVNATAMGMVVYIIHLSSPP